VAVVNVLLHLIGLALAWIAMRPGMSIHPLPERMAYLSLRPWGWSLGWAVWGLCALALVAFLWRVDVLAKAAPWHGVVLPLAAAGAAVDLWCDALWITLVPALARQEPALFLVFERALLVGGTVVANGLYSVAVLVATLGLRQAQRLSAAGVIFGLTTFTLGVAMVMAGLAGDPQALEWITGPTMLSFMAWALCVASVEDS